MMSVYLERRSKERSDQELEEGTAYEERPRQVNDVKRVTSRGKALKRGSATKGMTKKSTTPATIQPEVWIAFGLLSSLVQQIVASASA